MGDIQLNYCPHCLGNNIIKKHTDKCIFINNGFMALKTWDYKCPMCGHNLVTMNLTLNEWWVISCNSTDQNFIFALDKLKKEDPIEFTLKINQFIQINKNKIEEERQAKIVRQNIPKCPTCGSTNIKRISNTKRWVTTGMFGLGSSNVGKTMQCNSCGYKF